VNGSANFTDRFVPVDEKWLLRSKNGVPGKWTGTVRHCPGIHFTTLIGKYTRESGRGGTAYITPKDMLAEPQQGIHAEQDQKLEEARKQRQILRRQAADALMALCPAWGEA
jgi:hypothetical protein